MDKTNLLERYPNLLEKVRQWDCSFEEAIKRIERNKKDGTIQKTLPGILEGNKQNA